MIPILIYHSINEPRLDHVWGVLSLPPTVFEAQMAHIRRSGMTPISLAQVVEGIRDPASLPPRPVAVTFDDGYVDNWLFALPILERYEIEATIFPPLSFVDPRGGVRNRDGVQPGDIESYGFLTFDELRAMEATGLFRVESHSLTHTEIESGPEILDFHHPAGDAYWLYWLRHPERMPDWLTADVRGSVPLGTPVYRHGYAMVEHKWTVPEVQVAACQDWVADRGGIAAFERPGWRAELQSVAMAAAPSDWNDPAMRETEEDYRARVEHELVGSRELLEREMGHEVRYLCWPCGLFDKRTQEMALAAGYHATLDCECRANAPGQDPHLLHRIYFGQDERYLRIRTDRLLQLRFQGELLQAHGHGRGKLHTVVANRSMAVIERVGDLFGRWPTPRVISESGSGSN